MPCWGLRRLNSRHSEETPRLSSSRAPAVALAACVLLVQCDGNHNPVPDDPVRDRVVPTAQSLLGDTGVTPHRELILEDSAVLAIGHLGLAEDDPVEFVFAGIQGAVRLSDGSIIMADDGTKQVRRFSHDGQHVWSVGGPGRGPGEFQAVRLLHGCTDDEVVTIWDTMVDRITELDSHDGSYRQSWQPRTARGRLPYSDLVCGGARRSAFTGFEDVSTYEVSEGDHYRWTAELHGYDHAADTSWLIRSDIPGPDRTRYEFSDGPRTWGRKPILEADADGIWLGVGDEYALERMDWSGETVRVVRWSGPPLSVEDRHISAWHDRYVREYQDDPARLARFLDVRWPRILRDIPSRFPTYSDLIVLADGTLWVKLFERPGEPKEWRVFSPTGDLVYGVVEPPLVQILHPSPASALVLVWRSGAETLEVRNLRPGS